MTEPVVVIKPDMTKACAECGDMGALGSGVCLKCASSVMDADVVLKSPQAQALRRALNRTANSVRDRMAAANRTQGSLEGMDPPPVEPPHMIARVTALAVKLVFPFIAKNDVRYYLCGVNIRPLEDGAAMLTATDGHRYIVIRDPNGWTEEEITVTVQKDGMKHATEAGATFDVMSDGKAMILGKVAQDLFIQPGKSVIDEADSYPRIERVASVQGYTEGISGAVNPRYLADALEAGAGFGSVRFYTRPDSDTALMFVYGGIGELECFGGIMRLRDQLDALPAWFPRPTEPSSLSDV